MAGELGASDARCRRDGLSNGRVMTNGLRDCLEPPDRECCPVDMLRGVPLCSAVFLGPIPACSARCASCRVRFIRILKTTQDVRADSANAAHPSRRSAACGRSPSPLRIARGSVVTGFQRFVTAGITRQRGPLQVDGAFNRVIQSLGGLVPTPPGTLGSSRSVVAFRYRTWVRQRSSASREFELVKR